MTLSPHAKTVRVSQQVAECLRYRHLWEQTIAPGLLACTRCYITACCPVCLAVFPGDHRRLVYCSIHRASQEPDTPSSASHHAKGGRR